MSRIRFAIVFVAAMVFCAVAANAQTVISSKLISFETLNGSGGDDLVHTFSEEPETVRVKVHCKLKRGRFAWRVEAPDGEVLWQREVEAKSNLEIEEVFPGQAGEWRIVIDYKNAKGRYHIKMEQAKGG